MSILLYTLEKQNSSFPNTTPDSKIKSPSLIVHSKQLISKNFHSNYVATATSKKSSKI
jgi:hypothetical protein